MESSRHFSIEPYCVLCREMVVSAYYRMALEIEGSHPQESFELDALGFFRLPESTPGRTDSDGTEDVRTHAFRVRVTGRDWCRISRPMERLRRLFGDDSVCREARGCVKCRSGPESSVFLVHIACCQLAKLRFGADTVKRLYFIAQRTYPLVARRHTLTTGSSARAVPDVTIHDRTALGQLLSLISRKLPSEIQSMILGHVPGLFRSLQGCLETLAWASLPAIGIYQPAGPILTTEPFSQNTTVRHITGEVIDVLGEPCLARILATDSTGDVDGSTRISDVPIFGIQVSLGTYGLVAVRVLYVDHSASSWLGSPGRWFATWRCDDLRRLRAFSDGWKLLGIDQPTSPVDVQSLGQQQTRFVWSCPQVPGFLGRKCSILDGADDSSPPVFANPSVRLSQYLSLQGLGDDGLTSITMRLQETGVMRTLVDGDESRILGRVRSHGVAVTHYFAKDEVITSVRVITRRAAPPWDINGPHILLLTSHHRALYFGLYDFLWSQDCERTEFEVPASHKVIGFFKDPACTRFPYSFGVATAPSTHETSIEGIYAPILDGINDSTFMGVWRHNAFLSKARLMGAKMLAVQRNGSRCTGILIEYDGGQKCALGQWDAAAGSVETLYDNQRDGPLQSLHFVYSDGDRHGQYIESISIVLSEVDMGSDASSHPNCFTWTEFDKELAWYFTPIFDHLEVWQGTSALLDPAESVMTLMPAF